MRERRLSHAAMSGYCSPEPLHRAVPARPAGPAPAQVCRAAPSTTADVPGCCERCATAPTPHAALRIGEAALAQRAACASKSGRQPLIRRLPHLVGEVARRASISRSHAVHVAELARSLSRASARQSDLRAIARCLASRQPSRSTTGAASLERYPGRAMRLVDARSSRDEHAASPISVAMPSRLAAPARCAGRARASTLAASRRLRRGQQARAQRCRFRAAGARALAPAPARRLACSAANRGHIALGVRQRRSPERLAGRQALRQPAAALLSGARAPAPASSRCALRTRQAPCSSSNCCAIIGAAG